MGDFRAGVFDGVGDGNRISLFTQIQGLAGQRMTPKAMESSVKTTNRAQIERMSFLSIRGFLSLLRASLRAALLRVKP